ncbi:hypothetical protein CAPTEDRAFT_115120 [Capitella teleta]|uniref:ABC transporter domain-containing protein n=1 Tax=Capitella teleta TaxID=283909 RepID=R7UHP3_CAPTE|nr:hypothetical protein CAPTEDRAFT_115120 [Capitella teleta]|eukprot:ELU05735.1 hypothetical protein CAPTEDRAFT_115120 [Capitella teleta]
MAVAGPSSVLQRSTSTWEGSTITFHDVCYTVEVSSGIFSRQTTQKEIIRNVSGIFKPGMNAILGPTGSGKSSLLDMLAGRKNPKGLSGTLLVDGEKQPKNFKSISGYVTQDDVVTGTLTPRESIAFSANLRLGPEITDKEKRERIEDTIIELGLEKCADSQLGTAYARGVSGGERKRTCIGMELVIKPPVLFLDEPTTGLDASTASAVMTLLKGLSQRGRTIVFSIHQPRYSIYRHFDRLMLLSNGETVFHGPAMEALVHFRSIGYQCEARNNPPDFFLDVILGDIERTKTQASIGADGVGESEESEKSEEALQRLSTELAEEFKISSYQKHGQVMYNFSLKVGILSGRCIKNLTRNKQATIVQAGVLSFFGFVTGLIYFQLDNNGVSGVSNRSVVGVLFFMSMNMTFSNGAAVIVFITERAIFVHESISGFYRTSSYFVSKVLFDLLPLRFIPTTIYSLISYFMIGLQTSAGNFFTFYLILLLTTCVASSMAFMAGSVSSIFAVANIVFSLIGVLMMIFGGLLVNINEMADWLSWMQYLSLFRYSLNALSINELKDMLFCPAGNATHDTTSEICNVTLGNFYMDNQGIAYDSDWDLWQNIVAMVGLLIGFMTLALIGLSRIEKFK